MFDFILWFSVFEVRCVVLGCSGGSGGFKLGGLGFLFLVVGFKLFLDGV